MLKWIYPAVNKFPKSQRRLLSDRIENTAIEILELVIELNHKDSKIHRKKIVSELQKLQILFRLSKDLSFLDFQGYEYVSRLINEIFVLLDKRGRVVTRTYRNLYEQLCSFKNLELAFRKARKNKRHRQDVMEFELNLEAELLQLKHELETMAYQPRQIKQFIIHDPKTRVISASAFRDRVVHHALCNIIEPIFDKTFIYDSYANRKGKGTHAALQRFDKSKRKVSRNGRLLANAKDNNMVYGYVLKADIKHYFDFVDHEVLMKIISRKIKDEKVLWLIRKILGNHNCKPLGKGMPIGNLTSQFFANVYLNELDYFVKHALKAKRYMRYVDDFVILHESKEILVLYKAQINEFLETINLELHPQKSKIIPLHKGINLLGFRIFYEYYLPKKSNIRRMMYRIDYFIDLYKDGIINKSEILERIEGWNAYAIHANTYKFRRNSFVEILR